MGPLEQRIRSFGRPVPQKPKTRISTPPPPVSGVRGSSRRTKRKTVTRTTPDTSSMPEGLRQAYEEQKTIPPMEGSKVTQLGETPDKYKQSTEKTYGKFEGIKKMYSEPAQRFETASQQLQSGVKQVAKSETLQRGGLGSGIVVTSSTGETQFQRGPQAALTLYQMQQASKEYKKVGIELRKSEKEAKMEWGPETKVVFDTKSKQFRVDFPFVGAEKYYTYKRSVEQGGFGGLLATAFTPEDPLGIPSAFYTATGEKERAKEVKIKAVGRIKSIRSPLDAVSWYASMPTTQIGLAAVGGYGFGKAGAYATGRIAGNVAAARALQAGGVAAGTALVAPAAYDIFKEVESGRPGEALGKGVTLGFAFAGGIGGAKAGMRSTSGFFGKGKGLYPSEYGYYKTLKSKVSSGKLPTRVMDAAKPLYEKILPDIRLRGLSPEQAYPGFGNIQAFQKSKTLPRFFKRFMVRRRSEGFGGAFTEKTSTHDVDIMVRSPLSQVELEYGIGRLGYQPKGISDIKPLQRRGSIVSLGGATKEASYRYPGGLRTMKYSEQFARLSQSSLGLAHKGRVKDIPETLRMLEIIYGKTGGVPKSMVPAISEYKTAMLKLQTKPYILSPETSTGVYGPSFSKRFWETREKIWDRILPGRVMEGSFKKTYDPTGELMLRKSSVQVQTSKQLGEDVLGRTFTSRMPGGRLQSYPIYEEKPTIYLSKSAYKQGESFITLKHEMLHQLHPRAPEWMIGRVGEKIPNKWLESIVTSKLPPSPSFAATSPSISSMLSSSFFASPVSTVPSSKQTSLRQPSYTYKKSIIVKPPVMITKPSSTKTQKTTPISPTVSTSKTKTSSPVVPPIIQPSVSPVKSSSKTSSSFMTSFYPAPPSIYKSIFGRGKRQPDFKLFGKKKKFRSVQVKSPLKGLKL